MTLTYTSSPTPTHIPTCIRTSIVNKCIFIYPFMQQSPDSQAQGSNFDRPPPSRSDWEHLTHTDQNGFHIAIANLYAAGIEVVRGILDDWDCTYARGIAPSNYIGDIFGSLGGQPDFGFGSITGGRRLKPAAASSSSSSGGGGVGVSNWTGSGESLAGVEMARRRRFGVKGAMKM